MSSNINRDYLIKLNVKTSTFQAPSIYFYNTDVSTSNIYVQLIVHETLLEVTPIEQASNYSIKVSIIKPNNAVKELNGVLVNERDSIFEFNLPEDCTNLSGTYRLEFYVQCLVNNREELTTSFPMTYEVKKSILTGFISGIDEADDETVIGDLLLKLASKFDDVKVNQEKSDRDKIVLDFYSQGAVVKSIEIESTSSEIINVNTIEERDAIDTTTLKYGDFCYVKEDANETYIYYYSINGWASIGTKHPVEISATAPTNKQVLWIDTSYNNPNPDVSNDSVPPTVKFLLNKITDLYSEINTLKTELEEIKKMIESGDIKPPTPTSGTIFITESGEYLTTESGDYFGME